MIVYSGSQNINGGIIIFPESCATKTFKKFSFIRYATLIVRKYMVWLQVINYTVKIWLNSYKLM